MRTSTASPLWWYIFPWCWFHRFALLLLLLEGYMIRRCKKSSKIKYGISSWSIEFSRFLDKMTNRDRKVVRGSQFFTCVISGCRVRIDTAILRSIGSDSGDSGPPCLSGVSADSRIGVVPAAPWCADYYGLSIRTGCVDDIGGLPRTEFVHSDILLEKNQQSGGRPTGKVRRE